MIFIKKLLYCLSFVLFLQNFNNLNAMHRLGVSAGICFHTTQYAGLCKDTKFEIKDAAATMSEWLTPDIVEKLVDSEGIIKCQELYELPYGQRAFLSCWAAYPQYISYLHGYFEYYSSSEIQRKGKKLADALNKLNFGDAFVEKILKFSTDERLGCWELYFNGLIKIIPYLLNLKEKFSYINRLEFEDEINKCNHDIKEKYPEISYIDWQSIIFLLKNPYFFMSYILTWSNQNNKNQDGQYVFTDTENRIIELFLEYGFDVNSRLWAGCDDRDTLLHRAVRYDDIKMVELLLKWGADPLICYERESDPLKRYNGGGQSPWELSCYKMRGETWIIPNRAPTEKTQKIHEMLFSLVHRS